MKSTTVALVKGIFIGIFLTILFILTYPTSESGGDFRFKFLHLNTEDIAEISVTVDNITINIQRPDSKDNAIIIPVFKKKGRLDLTVYMANGERLSISNVPFKVGKSNYINYIEKYGHLIYRKGHW